MQVTDKSIDFLASPQVFLSCILWPGGGGGGGVNPFSHRFQFIYNGYLEAETGPPLSGSFISLYTDEAGLYVRLTYHLLNTRARVISLTAFTLFRSWICQIHLVFVQIL